MSAKKTSMAKKCRLLYTKDVLQKLHKKCLYVYLPPVVPMPKAVLKVS